MKRLYLFVALMVVCNGLFAQNGNKIGDTIHAIHYAIHLTEINTANHTIVGHTLVRVVPLVEGITSIPLELKDLTVDSVFVSDQQAVFNHTGELIRIQLAASAGTTDTLLLTVYYHGQPFHENWGGFHFSGDYAFNLGVGFQSIPHNLGKAWFPCVDNFTDRATYDVFATVGNNKKAIGGGLLVDTIDNGNGTTTWHWQLAHPLPTYLVSIATGNYVRYSDVYYGLEDTIPIYIYTRPSEQGNVAGSFVRLKDILQFYENHFGAYPFSRVGYVGTAIGAMEHAANIAYPNYLINGNTTDEYLYAHELSHMWFGDEVTCASAEEMWLNEGWASFCEMYYKEDIYGNDLVLSEMRDRNKKVLLKTNFIDNGYWALDSVPQQYTYGSTSYDKGAVVVNTLRGYLGDSLFFPAITAYLDSMAWQSKSSADLRDFLTYYTGIDMSPFFDAWVFSPGTPHFSIDSVKVVPNGSKFLTDIYLKQKFKGFDFLADDNVLDVSFVDEHMNIITDTVHFSGETGHSQKSLPFYPKAVMLDLYERIDDATLDNYKIFTQTGSHIFPDTYFKLYIDSLPDTSLVRATLHMVAPDSLKTAVPGLRLSQRRYWSIVEVVDEGFKARGRFYYDHSQYLDENLIRTSNDSVVILYRKTSANDWKGIPQTRYGIWSLGYIYVDQLKAGEYTLAVWDKQTVGIKKHTLEKIKIKIYPNPTHGFLNIEMPENGQYRVGIFDWQARLLKRFRFKGKYIHFNINTIAFASGVVYVMIYRNNKLLKSQNIVLIK